jgi:hypothetical protein
MKNDWCHSRAVAVLPLIAVVVLYATYAYARRSFFFCNTGRCNESIPANLWRVLKIESGSEQNATEKKEDLLSQELRLRERTSLIYSGRMTWYFLMMIYLFICAGSITVSLIIIFHLFPNHRVLLLLLPVTLSSLFGIYFFSRPAVHMVLFMEIFKNTIVKDVPSIERITNLLDSIGNAAAFCLLLTSCAILLAPYHLSFPQGLRELSRRMSYARSVLYTGTLLLIVTILLKGSLYQWSLAFTSREPAAVKIASSFVSSLLAVEGGFYTLVLVAVYVPAAVVLQRRAYCLRKLPTGYEEREKMFAQHGMTFSLKEALPRILAILGPFLAGPIGQFLSRSA